MQNLFTDFLYFGSLYLYTHFGMLHWRKSYYNMRQTTSRIFVATNIKIICNILREDCKNARSACGPLFSPNAATPIGWNNVTLSL